MRNISKETIKKVEELISIINKIEDIPHLKKRIDKDENLAWLRGYVSTDHLSDNEYNRFIELLDFCEDRESIHRKNNCWDYFLHLSDVKEKELKEKYEKKGIEIDTINWPTEDPFIHYVVLEIDDSDWVDLIQIDGELMPSCCGQISDIRDVLIDSLRNNKTIKASKLYEIVDTLKNHHDCSDDPNKIEEYLFKLWEDIKEDVKPDVYCSFKDANNLKDAVSIVRENFSEIELESVFSKDEFEFEKFVIEKSIEVYPAFKTLIKVFEDGFKSIKGYAVVQKNDDKWEICYHHRQGCCLYKDSKKAEQISSDYNQSRYDSAERKNQRDAVEDEIEINKSYVCEAIISFENGIEFLSDPYESKLEASWKKKDSTWNNL